MNINEHTKIATENLKKAVNDIENQSIEFQSCLDIVAASLATGRMLELAHFLKYFAAKQIADAVVDGIIQNN